MTIALPDTNGLSVSRAAQAYVDAGIPIAPFDPSKGNGKACGYLVGGEGGKWHERVTTDRAMISAWRQEFGSFNALALATSPGAFGACVLDVDRPNKVPREWRSLLEDVPFVATRPDEHKRRGHYYFALPEGHPSIGNSPYEWGDVRSYGGGIVLPPYPNDNRYAVRPGPLPILPAKIAESVAGSRGGVVQSVILEEFCTKYQANRYPGKLKGQISIHDGKLAELNPHDAMVYVLKLGLGEAALGFVPAKAVLDAFRARWDRSAREFQGIAQWCAATVEGASAADLKELEDISRRPKGTDSRMYAGKLA